MHEVGAEELVQYQNLARKYAKNSLLPLFDGDFPDGDLRRLPEVLDVAFSTGIAVSADLSISESSYGIWGSVTADQGMTASLLLLSIIAETCGGVAMCLHAQGVASNLITCTQAKQYRTPVRVGLCLQEGVYPPYPETIIAPDKDAPARITTVASIKENSYVINGIKSFVYSMGGVDTYLVFARTHDGWGCFSVPSDDKRIKRTDVGARTGLRACLLEHVEFGNVTVPIDARLDDGDAGQLVLRALGINWAGISAIALGIAKGAVAAAYAYAAERYQGGNQIEHHPAVKMLIGGAVAALKIAESTVYSFNKCNFTTIFDLAKMAAAKLEVTQLCSRAVTDCLQTFGGYGYMEEFGMEKRLRDVTVLKSASGSPTYLKQFVFQAGRENLL